MDENRSAIKQKRKSSKMHTIAAIAAGMVLVSAISLLLWHSHIQSLRNEMEAHLSQSIAYVERGQNDLAYLEAFQARELAKRLGDNSYEQAALRQSHLIISVNSGLELFDEHRFPDAYVAFSSALEHAQAVDGLDTHFIRELIEITDEHIHFEEMISYAGLLVEQGRLEDALAVYESALAMASSLLFDEGIKLAEDSIEDTRQRIIEAKRTLAIKYEAQGDFLYENELFQQAIVYFQGAFEIYREIGDPDAANEISSKIEAAEQSLAAYLTELQRLEAERLEEEQREEQKQEKQNSETQNHEEAPSTGERPSDNSGSQVGGDVNYEHNRSIYFDLKTPIDNQNSSPANLIRMGSRPGLNEGWYNGCGWIAAYNALIILGEPVHPAEIVNHFKANQGTVFDGVLGTFPDAIERFLVDSGHDVTHTLFPGRTLDLDEAIRSSRVSILAYAHTRTAHFVTIVYRPDENIFVVYNDSFARRRSAVLGLENAVDIGSAVDSITALFRNTPEMLFSFSLITVN